MRTLLVLLFVLAACPLLAEDKVIVATCAANRGCTCSLSNLTATEVAIVLGTDLPPSGTGEAKIVEFDGEMMWTRLSLAEINVVAGGNDECPLRLFPEEQMVPLDGSWVGTSETKSISGCPPGIEAILPVMVKGMVFPRRMAWGGRFHPDKMRDPTSERAIRWREVTPRSFRGEPVNINASAGAAKITVDFQATLISPETIRGLVRLQLRSDPGPGAKMALEIAGLSNCLVVTRFNFRRDGK